MPHGPRKRSSPRRSGRSKSLRRKAQIASGAQFGTLGPEATPRGPGAAFNEGKKADGTPDGLVGLLQKAGPFSEVLQRIAANFEDD